MRTASVIELTDEQRQLLQRWVRSNTASVRLARRARIILLAAEGMDNSQIARKVDVGRIQVGRWRERFAVIATDDHRQSEALARAGKFAYPGPFDADLGDLVTGRHPGRRTQGERTMFTFGGSALGDLASALAIYEVACARDLGVRLPR